MNFTAAVYCAYPEKQARHVVQGARRRREGNQSLWVTVFVAAMSRSGHRAGRAARKREKKRGKAFHSVSLSHQLQYVRLMKFLHQQGFTSTHLQPALFTDTGRGLQTLTTIKPGELVVSLPESCLLTTSTVLNSYLGPFIKRWRPRPSALLVLCVFLICERHLGETSHWFPYISVLPTSYTCPAYFSDQVMDVLPTAVRRRGLEQREAVWEMHSSSQEFFRSLQPVLRQPAENVLSFEALRWAWCCVNTRSVFMSQPSNRFLSGQDNYALAPFLDLLNHRPDVQMGCYEIRSIHGMPRYEQVFINYGCHDNQCLLLEYGFVASPNPHSVVYVETDLLSDVLKADKSLDQKLKFLRENNFLDNLTVSSEGPSWRLMTVLRLCSLSQMLYHLWKDVLLGRAVSEKMEAWSFQTVKALCRRMLQDTQTALEKISLLLQQCEQPITAQLDVVRSLHLEESNILKACLKQLKEPVEGDEEIHPQTCCSGATT